MNPKSQDLENLVISVTDQIITWDGYEEFLDAAKRLKSYLTRVAAEDIILDILLSTQEKHLQLTELITAKVQQPVLYKLISTIISRKYFALLTANNFNSLLGMIAEEVEALPILKLTLALQLEPSDLLEVKARLASKYKTKFLLELKLKKNILGGFILEKDSTIVDASLEKVLEDYRHNWANALTNKMLN